MAVLVNNRTEGAAEVLAAALRQETGSPLIGQATAGRHGVFREVGLGDGTRLQVPAGRIRLGVSVTLAAGPIPPDIRIPVPENTERGFLGNPTAALKSNGTNGITGANGSASLQRRKVTEADLVRAQRSEPTDSTTETHAAEKAAAPIRLADPVLARAADLVRGLNAFQKAR
jgi:C-terminal processing protease CtpA/Prc